MAKKLLFSSLLLALSAYAADGDLSPVAKVFDSQLSGVDREVVSLAEAMPAENYGFAPKGGEFKGVRTFAQQATHIASVNFAVAAAVLGEANPVDMGKDENGSADLKSKEQVLAYLKKSYGYAHQAMRMLTGENLMAPVQSAFGSNQVARLSMATVAVSHSFDHYGQMAVYARMCGMVPPASRPR